MAFQLSLLALLAAAAVVPGVLGRLAEPGDGHQLTVAEADAGVNSDANPQVDAWHDAEQKKIEVECSKLLKQLMVEKGRKLQDIVDQKQRELEAEEAKLQDAKDHTRAEKVDLEKQHFEAATEKGKIPSTKADVNTAAGEHDKWEKEVLRLQTLVFEKKACLDRLRAAKADMLAAQRHLAALRRELAEKEAYNAAQKEKIQKEEGHVKKENTHVDDSEAAFARAQARLDAALARLAQAMADLEEHDGATPPNYNGDATAGFLLHGARSVEAGVPAAAQPPKSSTTRTVVGAGAAALSLAALLL